MGMLAAAVVPTPVGAAPGETWSGTLKVTERLAAETTDAFGNQTSSYSKLHETTFTVSSVAGNDDDIWAQPLAGWSTTINESNNSGGRCPSYTSISGQASGTDGRLQMTPESGGQMLLEVLEFGSPGNFPVTQRSGDCQNGESASTSFATHQTFSVRTAAEPDAPEIAGSLVQQVSNGTLTYEWELVREQHSTNPGTDGDDQLSGSESDDLIYLMGGNDLYNALGGNDSVYGDNGDDQLAGGAGDDLLYGGANQDRLIGGDGADSLRGGGGNDTISGDGINEITGSMAGYEARTYLAVQGPDFLFGQGGRDKLIGGPGLDRFNGGAGADTCIVDSRKEKRRARGCETIKLRRAR